MKKANLLICDDEVNIREGLKKSFSLQGYKVFLAADGKEALKLFLSEKIDLAILDIRMPRIDGLAVLKKMNNTNSAIPVIFMTGHGTVETAVEAMRLGAYDFMIKPLNLDRLDLIVERALEKHQLLDENRKLREKLSDFSLEKHIIGKSRAINKVIDRIRQVGQSKSNVLIFGESGTGKEVVCDAIHQIYKGDAPLIKVNCSALSSNLLESELFGYEKGAFTGANETKIGRIEAAEGGTLFLDEVSEISLEVQVKLLRVIQEKKIERVGSNKSVPVDFRLICASNKDLTLEIKEGRFREDFYFRLNVIDINLPPLRERRGDIEILAKYFFDYFSSENNISNLHITNQVYQSFNAYDWPGNIRQLKNVIEKMVVLSSNNKITQSSLPDEMKDFKNVNDILEIQIGESMDEIEKKVILQTIGYCRGNKTEAAKILGIGRKTLHRKINE